MRENLFVIFWLEGRIESWPCHSIVSSNKPGKVLIKTNFEEDQGNWIDGEKILPLEISTKDLIAIQPYNP